jgi:hypothetical protein
MDKRWEEKQVNNKAQCCGGWFYEFMQPWSLVCNTTSPIYNDELHLAFNSKYWFTLFVNLVLFSIRLGTHGKTNKIFMVYLLVILVINWFLLIYPPKFITCFYLIFLVGQFILLSLFYKSLFKSFAKENY